MVTTPTKMDREHEIKINKIEKKHISKWSHSTKGKFTSYCNPNLRKNVYLGYQWLRVLFGVAYKYVNSIRRMNKNGLKAFFFSCKV